MSDYFPSIKHGQFDATPKDERKHDQGCPCRFKEVENPTCDICDEPMICERGDDCDFHAGDWNGETGCHISCEEAGFSPNESHTFISSP